MFISAFILSLMDMLKGKTDMGYDVFLFTHDDLALESIQQVASELGFATVGGDMSHGILRITGNDGKAIQVAQLDSAFAGFELEQQRTIQYYKPTSAFAISFNPNSAAIMKKVVEQFIKNPDAWVGCDDGLFSTKYTLHNLDNIMNDECWI